MNNLNKSRRDELLYAFRLFDVDRNGSLSFVKFKALLESIGIFLTKQELRFLSYEEDMRGGFTLDDLYAIGQAFYNDEVIKEKVKKSFNLHFKTLNKDEFKKVLLKLGTGIRISEAEIDSFFNYYVKDLNIDELINV